MSMIDNTRKAMMEAMKAKDKPRKEALFDETREKIYEFKYQHPKYNIQVFEHSFDFDLDEK